MSHVSVGYNTQTRTMGALELIPNNKDQPNVLIKNLKKKILNIRFFKYYQIYISNLWPCRMSNLRNSCVALSNLGVKGHETASIPDTKMALPP